MKRQAFFNTITEGVKAAEQKTSAELVVSLRHHSGSYRDVGLLLSMFLALLTLLWAVYADSVVGPQWIVPEAMLAGLVGYLLPVIIPQSLRFITLGTRRRRQVEQAALAEFMAAGVSRTKNRTGILIFASYIERLVYLVCDLGVEKALPPEAIKAANQALSATLSGLHFEERFPKEIAKLGDVLAPYLPRSADDANELEDAPRFEA